MKLASIFSDHAVLQREINVPVWGWTRPLSPVVVKVGPYTAQSLSGTDGKFMVRLPVMKAGGPYELEVSCPDSDEKAIRRDIWIGEVWLASGQSNMEYKFADENQATDSGLHMATVPHLAHAGRQSDVAVSWAVASRTTSVTFSAVALHFARQLQEALGVKIGIIDASWGGTIIETWTSRETLVRNDDVSDWVARYEADTHAPAFWTGPAQANRPAPFPLDPGNQGLEQGWANTDFDDRAWGLMKIPGSWTAQGHNYSGIFWFRKTIDIPAAWAGKDITLALGAADKQDITYFNGQQVGATGCGLDEIHWSEQRVYCIPGHLVKAGKNVIATRVYSFAYAGGLIGPAENMTLSPKDMEDQAIALAGEWKYAIERNFGLITPPNPALGPGNSNSPYMLFDNMIAPLIPYALRGAIWYQGESNANRPEKYQRLMTDMIRDWRRVWGQGDFPFLSVQLANFITGDNWPLLREAQLQSLCEPNTGMAVTIDIGNPIDVHPTNKRDVGKRLALWALSETYGKNVEASGPLYAGMMIEDSRIRLRFSHVQGGLVAKGGKLKTFVIAGEDRNFVPADAVIDGDTVVVSSPAVAAPMAARYAWQNDPEGCNLYNGSGLPASPLRTDKW